jgi:hypothetical protein
MTSYIIGDLVHGAVHVTGPDGTTSLVPGLPIIDTTPLEAAVAAGFVDDSDSVLAPAVAGGAVSLLPALHDDPETLYAAAVVPGSVTLSAALFTDDDAIYAATSGDTTQTVQAALVDDADAVYALTTSRFLRPPMWTDVTFIHAPAIGATVLPVLQPATVASDDAVYAFTTTRFTQPALVPADDVIPASDVGWKVFAELTTDVDATYGSDAFAYNDVLPETWFDEENVEGYPFFVQGVTGGISTPPRIGLTGSIRPQRRVLTGSVTRQIHLTGFLNDAVRAC